MNFSSKLAQSLSLSSLSLSLSSSPLPLFNLQRNPHSLFFSLSFTHSNFRFHSSQCVSILFSSFSSFLVHSFCLSHFSFALSESLSCQYKSLREKEPPLGRSNETPFFAWSENPQLQVCLRAFELEASGPVLDL